jgi:hypothetical protein
MNAVNSGLIHAHDGRFAMTVQKFDAPIAPNTLLISTLSDTIAPIANIIASALISLFRRFAKRRDDGLANSAAFPAPHVALVTVPGNFVTGPFTRR